MSHHCFGAGFRAEATGLDWMASSRKYPAAPRSRTASFLSLARTPRVDARADNTSGVWPKATPQQSSGHPSSGHPSSGTHKKGPHEKAYLTSTLKITLSGC